LSSRNEVEGSAVRPAVLSNPAWEATRMNHPLRIYPHPQLRFPMPGRSTRWSS